MGLLIETLLTAVFGALGVFFAGLQEIGRSIFAALGLGG